LETFKVTAGLGQVTEAELVAEYAKAKAEYGNTVEETFKECLGIMSHPSIFTKHG
jgi:type I restriction enzyme M protein